MGKKLSTFAVGGLAAFSLVGGSSFLTAGVAHADENSISNATNTNSVAGSSTGTNCTPMNSSQFNWSVENHETPDKADSGTWRFAQKVKVGWDASNLTGTCAGSETFVMSDEIAPLGGSSALTNNIVDKDGNVLGTQVWSTNSDGKVQVVITLNDYAATHQNVAATGYLESELNSSLVPGQDNNLTWTVGDTTVATLNIKAANCDDCNTAPTQGYKYGSVDANKKTGDFHIITRQFNGGDDVVIDDKLTSPGQEINCDSSTMDFTRVDKLNAWGSTEASSEAPYTIKSCTATELVIEFTATDGNMGYVLDGHLLNIDTADYTSWTDTANVADTTTGDSQDEYATLQAQDSGATGQGNGYTPKIQITKVDAQGNHAPDPAAPVNLGTSPADTTLKFTVTNNGDEGEKNVDVSDVADGSGTVGNLSCDFSTSGDTTAPTSGTHWDGVLKAGASFTCTATLTGVTNTEHNDTATVTAYGIHETGDNGKVTSTDQYHATATPPAPAPQYNLVLEKKLTSAAVVKNGDTVTYQLNVHNDGPNTAVKGWSVTEVPGAWEQITSMSANGMTCDVSKLTCVSSSDLPTGAVEVVNVTGKVVSGTNGQMRNVAYVSPSKDQGYDETNKLVVPTNSTDTTTTPTDNDSQAVVTVNTPAPKPIEVSIGDYYAIDKGDVGRQDKADVGVKGVTITVHRTDGKPVVDVNGKPVTTTVTNQYGWYTFDHLPVLPTGVNYYTTAPLLPGYTWTTPNVGDRKGDYSPGKAVAVALTTNGARDDTLDFGVTKLDNFTFSYQRDIDITKTSTLANVVNGITADGKMMFREGTKWNTTTGKVTSAPLWVKGVETSTVGTMTITVPDNYTQAQKDAAAKAALAAKFGVANGAHQLAKAGHVTTTLYYVPANAWNSTTSWKVGPKLAGQQLVAQTTK